MDGYIKKEKVLSSIDKAIENYAEKDDILEFLSDIRFAVIGQPPADVQEVVRCGECKHCMKAVKYELWCAGHGYPHRLTTADDFCSKGERQ